MFGSEILDVAIGLFFVYALLGLICSALRELAEAWFKTRASFLHDGLRELLKDPAGRGLVKALYEHPSVAGLYRGSYDPERQQVASWVGKTNLPAYIPASNFAVALLDLAARGPVTAENATRFTARLAPADIRAGITNIENPYVRRAILAALDLSGGDVTRAQANVEAWYNGAMDRVSGWYKRRTQLWLLLLGLVAAAALNVNSITLARYLYHDEAARAALVASAQAGARDPTLPGAPLDTLLARLDQLDLPIGWQYGYEGVRRTRPGSVAGPGTGAVDPADAAAVSGGGAIGTIPAQWKGRAGITALLGWLITALAVSLGAPFWFDLLNKVMVIRSTVKPHEKSLEESSEDRQSTDKRAGTGAPAGGGAGARGGSGGARRGGGGGGGGGEGVVPLEPAALLHELPDNPNVRL